MLLVAGVHSVAYAFPKVKIVTTAVDKEVNEQFHILPGIGTFQSFYFVNILFFTRRRRYSFIFALKFKRCLNLTIVYIYDLERVCT